MRSLLVLSALLLVAPVTGRAQTTETPVPFDSAGRILSLNESLAARLGLTPPAWPVTGSFAEARLFRSSDGTHVIVVQRSNGLHDRYQLTADQTIALRAAFVAATDRVGRVVVEDAASTIAEPARGPFVRDQMVLATVMYGPALASLTNDGATGTGAYLLSIGGTFFILTDMAKHRSITKAQNSLATDGAIRGWAATALVADAFNIDLGNHGAAWTALIGGIGGSIVGFQRGEHLTNSEAQAAMTGSTLAAGTFVGVAATLGLATDDNHAASSAVLIGGVAGYLLGPRYPREAGYTVTAGDISLVRLGAILGTAVALTPIVGNDNVDNHLVAGLATAGWVGGALLGDRLAARPFNHSSSDARMIQLGALGGGLMGAAFPIMMKSDNATFNMALITGGAIAGAFLSQNMMDPPRQGSEYIAPSHDSPSPRRFEIDPQGLAMTLTKQKGNHALLRITF